VARWRRVLEISTRAVPTAGGAMDLQYPRS